MASPMTIHGRVSKMDTIQMQANTKQSSDRSERKDSKWEILSNLENGQQYNIMPKKTEGILTKKRKWPMKGSCFYLSKWTTYLLMYIMCF